MRDTQAMSGQPGRNPCLWAWTPTRLLDGEAGTRICRIESRHIPAQPGARRRHNVVQAAVSANQFICPWPPIS